MNIRKIAIKACINLLALQYMQCVTLGELEAQTQEGESESRCRDCAELVIALAASDNLVAELKKEIRDLKRELEELRRVQSSSDELSVGSEDLTTPPGIPNSLWRPVGANLARQVQPL